MADDGGKGSQPRQITAKRGGGRRAAGAQDGLAAHRLLKEGRSSAAESDASAGVVRRSGSTRGLSAASACAQAAIRGAAGKRGIAEARLITHWRDIVGDDLAACSRPVRMKQRGGVALGGVLVLAVEGARASELEHRLPQLIERVNAHYGYGAVAEIKLTQAASGPFGLTEKPPRPRPASPSDLPKEKRQALSALTTPVEDDALRAALTRLGANVMTHGAKKAEKGRAPRGAGKPQRGVVRRLFAAAPASPRPPATPDAGPDPSNREPRLPLEGD